MYDIVSMLIITIVFPQILVLAVPEHHCRVLVPKYSNYLMASSDVADELH